MTVVALMTYSAAYPWCEARPLLISGRQMQHTALCNRSSYKKCTETLGDEIIALTVLCDLIRKLYLVSLLLLHDKCPRVDKLCIMHYALCIVHYALCTCPLTHLPNRTEITVDAEQKVRVDVAREP